MFCKFEEIGQHTSWKILEKDPQRQHSVEEQLNFFGGVRDISDYRSGEIASKDTAQPIGAQDSSAQI